MPGYICIKVPRILYFLRGWAQNDGAMTLRHMLVLMKGESVRILRLVPAIVLAMSFAATPLTVGAQVSPCVSLAVGQPPPPLPAYEQQPPPPAMNSEWTPGYWSWGPYGYYWIPGTWVPAPAVGLYWTPGYWGFVGAGYLWYPGYWGPTVGFYGGVNYGFGYFGVGYVGGFWAGNTFAYNTAVTNVNTTPAPKDCTYHP